MIGSFHLNSCYSSDFQQSLQTGRGGKNLPTTCISSMGFGLPQKLQVKIIPLWLLSTLLFQEGTLPLIKRPPLSLCSAMCAFPLKLFHKACRLGVPDAESPLQERSGYVLVLPCQLPGGVEERVWRRDFFLSRGRGRG